MTCAVSANQWRRTCRTECRQELGSNRLEEGRIRSVWEHVARFPNPPKEKAIATILSDCRHLLPGRWRKCRLCQDQFHRSQHGSLLHLRSSSRRGCACGLRPTPSRFCLLGFCTILLLRVLALPSKSPLEMLGKGFQGLNWQCPEDFWECRKLQVDVRGNAKRRQLAQ